MPEKTNKIKKSNSQKIRKIFSAEKRAGRAPDGIIKISKLSAEILKRNARLENMLSVDCLTYRRPDGEIIPVKIIRNSKSAAEYSAGEKIFWRKKYSIFFGSFGVFAKRAFVFTLIAGVVLIQANFASGGEGHIINITATICSLPDCSDPIPTPIPTPTPSAEPSVSPSPEPTPSLGPKCISDIAEEADKNSDSDHDSSHHPECDNEGGNDDSNNNKEGLAGDNIPNGGTLESEKSDKKQPADAQADNNLAGGHTGDKIDASPSPSLSHSPSPDILPTPSLAEGGLLPSPELTPIPSPLSSPEISPAPTDAAVLLSSPTPAPSSNPEETPVPLANSPQPVPLENSSPENISTESQNSSGAPAAENSSDDKSSDNKSPDPAPGTGDSQPAAIKNEPVAAVSAEPAAAGS